MFTIVCGPSESQCFDDKWRFSIFRPPFVRFMVCGPVTHVRFGVISVPSPPPSIRYVWVPPFRKGLVQKRRPPPVSWRIPPPNLGRDGARHFTTTGYTWDGCEVGELLDPGMAKFAVFLNSGSDLSHLLLRSFVKIVPESMFVSKKGTGTSKERDTESKR